MTTSTAATIEAELPTRGPYSLARVASMTFGHRNEAAFDGVLRLAFCLDGGYEQQVGVEVRQDGEVLRLRIVGDVEAEPVAQQVARVVSVDADGEAFAAVCAASPPLARLHRAAAGFRPALFYSPYEAAIWSVISARRGRAGGMVVRDRLNAALGSSFTLAGQPVAAAPTPAALLGLERLPGLPADRVPRLHAIARAAQDGDLEVERIHALGPEHAIETLQRLPGIGPFYSALIVIRASGFTDVLPIAEPQSRLAVEQVYGLAEPLNDEAYAELAEQWRPFRTWVPILARMYAADAAGAEPDR